MRAPRGEAHGALLREGAREGAPLNDSGFTLIEVMIAVAILSSITVLIYGSYQQTFKSKKVVEANLSRYRSARNRGALRRRAARRPAFPIPSACP